jgi:hypothetical protein
MDGIFYVDAALDLPHPERVRSAQSKDVERNCSYFTRT